MSPTDEEFEPEERDGKKWYWHLCGPSCEKKTGNGLVWCLDPPDSPCAKKGCRCRLFSKPKRGPGKWRHEKGSDFGRQIPEVPERDYECFCTSHSLKP
jgi:hypothetical protein